MTSGRKARRTQMARMRRGSWAQICWSRISPLVIASPEMTQVLQEENSTAQKCSSHQVTHCVVTASVLHSCCTWDPAWEAQLQLYQRSNCLVAPK